MGRYRAWTISKELGDRRHDTGDKGGGALKHTLIVARTSTECMLQLPCHPHECPTFASALHTSTVVAVPTPAITLPMSMVMAGVHPKCSLVLSSGALH